ncbi:type I glutamate--ammonia ligase [Caproiciproducens sp. NJN-50]|uniref:type I glutamate--ammonia ligase n=1 Tax=Acutalibacteraceae TaxID=3082771 RepID=UPI000FFE1E2B|nr:MULTISPECIES: type I glutamate--ammonia ligase [Acutalibacteraceae]QAT49715.1 type I glutamate--ammonia ligase [Caproiciproducens sp. NJN-50]
MPCMGRNDMIQMLHDNHVDFLSLQFTDIPGSFKNVTVTADQIEKALNNQCMFDGSSMEGFVRIQESDMYLQPDPETFLIYPWSTQSGRAARLICEIIGPDGTPYPGDPRCVLKKTLKRAADQGFTFYIGTECEFYLFQTDELGHPTTETNDTAGYFDLGPADQGENARRDICLDLEQMEFEIEASHHEAAYGQHEIDFKEAEALTAADHFLTFKMVVKSCANENGLYATFMPKPVFSRAGSGMCINISLFRNGRNAFYDASSENGLSRTALNFIAGLLLHIRSICAVTNPLVNSYKRLIPGGEGAPSLVGWSFHHRGTLIRVPSPLGPDSRVDLRSPDPTCNPYLSFALLLSAGMDGIDRDLLPPPSVVSMHLPEAIPADSEMLPADLGDAVRMMKEDPFVKKVLGDLVFHKYVEAKEEEWRQYSTAVTDWELHRYLDRL